ncbi:hypothetical protein R1flu_014115 [Riccia fluitans]|uniref:Uncharacterized protein n=1 Tax=Riccia fluitans TaxID=41844 RepID=A0ABD1YGA0_9MARC
MSQPSANGGVIRSRSISSRLNFADLRRDSLHAGISSQKAPCKQSVDSWTSFPHPQTSSEDQIWNSHQRL